jgi:hypothetical protein
MKPYLYNYFLFIINLCFELFMCCVFSFNQKNINTKQHLYLLAMNKLN